VTVDSRRQAELASRLAGRSGEIVDRLTELVAQRIEGLGTDELERGWVRSSVKANIELLLHVMTHPEDLSSVLPPLGGIALVRRIAQHDVPFYELVRAYHLAEWYWMRQAMREIAATGCDSAALTAQTAWLSDLVHDYVDRVCRNLSQEYEAERERWRHHAESARIGLITSLLNGAAADPAAAEAALGYRLSGRHLALVVWFAGQPESGDELARLTRAATRLAKRVNRRARPLLVARDHTTVWVWLPLPGSANVGVDITEALAGEPLVRVALGEPASDLAGFVTAHRQARTAHEIGLRASPDAGQIFPYREVSSLAFLCSDLARARAWVAEVLGPLSGGDRRTSQLRRTLAVYTAANRSATATARLMNCHKNTIQYRLHSAERLLGRPVDDAGLDLDLALLACRWLGTAVAGTTPDTEQHRTMLSATLS
jgi:DNA-binding PucR family transcriptional regulator